MFTLTLLFIGLFSLNGIVELANRKLFNGILWTLSAIFVLTLLLLAGCSTVKQTTEEPQEVILLPLDEETLLRWGVDTFKIDTSEIRIFP